ncbi:hypothetical protein Tco_0735422 [Tanacetum coccineum]
MAMSGSVETQGESSAAAASKRMPYCDMGLLPYGQANAFEVVSESLTRAQDSSFVSGYKKGPLVLDFGLSQHTGADAILPYSQADVLETGTDSHTTVHNSSFVSGHNAGQVVLDFASSIVLIPSTDGRVHVCSSLSQHVCLQSSVFASHDKAKDLNSHQTVTVATQGNSDTDFVTHEKRRSGVSSLYMDIGDCQWSCEHCKAKFWYGERLKGYSKDQQPHYHKCCSGGKVVLEDEREPPEYIKELFGDRNFLEHIRAYNQMFSMTSFGAHVDETINNGRGPYVFKVSGQIYHWIGTLCPFVGDPPRFLQLYIYDTENEITNRMRHFGGTQSAGLNEQTVEGLMRLLDECNELVRLFRTARDKCNGQQIPDFKIRLYNVVGVGLW